MIRLCLDSVADTGVVPQEGKRGGAGYVTRLWDYGGGLAEAVTYFRPSGRRSCASLRGQGDREASARRAGARARTAVRRRVLARRYDHLVTLTERANVQDLDELWRMWGQFKRMLERQTKQKLDYVAVPERQRRGAWHLHVAVRGFVNVPLWRALWWRVCGGRGQGNVDAQYRRALSRVFIARYLSKYLTKAYEEAGLLNRKRYATPHDGGVPYEEAPAFDRYGAIRAVLERAGRVVAVLADDAVPVVWACSWG